MTGESEDDGGSKHEYSQSAVHLHIQLRLERRGNTLRRKPKRVPEFFVAYRRILDH
ncbi:hypothetical protein [Paenibacillus sonchi]|uniref:hypothetical protein n=1 Tax=Paenibacillus sonchi TaxID=373687 RepID=UPI002D7FAEAD|nr:hypothetical protein [Paenibacillus sonchi]